jgi:nitrogen-specific signal transduction histidine kinase/ActR/RegA family two-component response regulator
MKIRRFICFLFVLAGLVILIIDSLIEYTMTNNSQNFLEILILDVPEHELFMRFQIILIIFILGFTISFLFDKHLKSQEKINNLNELSATTLRSIGDAVITLNINKEITFMNKMALLLLKETINEVIGKKINEVFALIEVDTGKSFIDFFDKVLRNGEIIYIKQGLKLTTKKGINLDVADSCAPIYNFESNIVGIVIVLQDITDQLIIEKEAAKSHQLESLGVLAGGIAHDFNNILMGIIGNLDLANLIIEEKENLSNEDQKIKAILLDALDNSQRATDLTAQLLTFSKGGAPIKKTIEIGKNLEKVANFILSGQSSKAIVEIQRDLWPIVADKGQLNQVIQNIVLNAAQSMPNGGIVKIKAENHAIEESKSFPLQGGKYVKISISDEGVGIPNKNKEKLFNPYYTTKKTGSGLGLTISFSIIKNHGGYIDFDSTEGIGTTFYIYFPVSNEIIINQEQISGIKKGFGKILIMDDDLIVQETYGEMMGYLGYQFDLVQSGEQALEMYRQNLKSEPYDLVILDNIISGGMGGKETLKQLKKIDRNIQSIIASGFSNDEILLKFSEFGFREVLIKPFTTRELGMKIDKVLNLKTKYFSI